QRTLSTVIVQHLDLSDAAFVTGSTELSPIWNESITTLLETLETEPSVLRITYLDTASERQLSRQRLQKIQRLITDRWKEKLNRYRLEIESRLVIGGTFAGAER